MVLHLYYFVLMTLRKLVGIEAGVQDLEFQVKPRSLVFEEKPIACFVLYLQKGMQIIGRYQSGLKHNAKESLYRFKNPEIGVFRLRNLSHATYTWNLYCVDPATGEEDFVDSVSFDLKQTVELYQVELLQKQREVQTSYKQKNIMRTAVLDLWKKTKKEMRSTIPLLKCIFEKHSVHFEFQVQIKNSLDLEIQEEETKNNGLRRVKSQQSQIGFLPNTTHLELATKSKGSQPLIIIDQCTSPFLRGAIKKHENQFSNPKQADGTFNQTQMRNEHLGSETVVKVTNPTGKQLGQADYTGRIQLRRSGSHTLEPVINLNFNQPNKAFSMLSDIIEQSHEGSSTIGQDKLTQNGVHNLYPEKIDQIQSQDKLPKSKNIVTVDSPLAKLRTLPYDSFNNRKIKEAAHIKADLRRAHTTEKDVRAQQQSQLNLADQYQTSRDLRSSEVLENTKQKKGTSGDLNAKYIILLGFLIILGIIGKEWFYDCRGPKCKKQKAARKVKS